MPKKTAEDVISELSLRPHPEGGWFKRTYTSGIEVESSNGIRPCSTSILYLLKRGEVSRLHYLDADETWYFHEGATLALHQFDRGNYQSVIIGNTQFSGALQQWTIRAGIIFGAVPDPAPPYDWSLVSCSVAPGYLAEGFFWPDCTEMRETYKKAQPILDLLDPGGR